MLAYLYTKPVNKCFCKITICINTMMMYLTLFTKLNFDVRSTFKLYYFVEYLNSKYDNTIDNMYILDTIFTIN